MDRPLAFISATGDLRSARDVVAKALLKFPYLDPVWQDIEPAEAGDLVQILQKRVERCSVLIQLVGYRYGAEPRVPIQEIGRASYTQYEAILASRRGCSVFYLFLGNDFPTDPADTEPIELRNLQAVYRSKIIEGNFFRQERISSSVELENAAFNIIARLAKDSRGPHRSAALAFFAVVRRWVDFALRAIASFRAQDGPEALPAAAIARAKLLAELGGIDDVARGKIAEGDHAGADILIQKLKRSSVGQALDVLTLEGNNWYRAGQPDKAILPYEQAFALAPDDLLVRSNLAAAHAFSRLDNISAHRHRAIEIATGTLKLLPADSPEWAATQNCIGLARADLRENNPEQNLREAILAYQSALRIFERARDATNWIEVQNNLGNAWMNMPANDRTDNLRKAIGIYESALGIARVEMSPKLRATLQNNLGSAWCELATGDRESNLRSAVAAFEQTLSLCSKESDPILWAMTNYNLGNAWRQIRVGNRKTNLRHAICAYEDALGVRTKDNAPDDFRLTSINLAFARNDLGNAFFSDRSGDREQNLTDAAKEFEAALALDFKHLRPRLWADTQKQLGITLYSLPERCQPSNMLRAIAAFNAALAVYAELDLTTDWAITQHILGVTWAALPGNSDQNKFTAISAFTAALSVVSRTTKIDLWAKIHVRLCAALEDLHSGDLAANLRQAVSSAKAALQVLTASEFPREYAELSLRIQCLKRKYEATPAARKLPFDHIPPAL